jgi:hypothetical protein
VLDGDGAIHIHLGRPELIRDLDLRERHGLDWIVANRLRGWRGTTRQRQLRHTE